MGVEPTGAPTPRPAPTDPSDHAAVQPPDPPPTDQEIDTAGTEADPGGQSDGDKPAEGDRHHRLPTSRDRG